MAAEIKKEIELEIAHVLFTDIVGYSKLPINQQRALVERLNEIVRGTDEFHIAETAGRLLTIPTGDGITLVFYHSPEAPVECALEISRALKKQPEKRTWLALASISRSRSWTAATPDTFCCRSTWLKIWRNTLTGSHTCMNLASVSKTWRSRLGGESVYRGAM